MKNQELIKLLLEKYPNRRFALSEVTLLLQIPQQSTTLSALNGLVAKGEVWVWNVRGIKQYQRAQADYPEL